MDQTQIPKTLNFLSGREGGAGDQLCHELSRGGVRRSLPLLALNPNPKPHVTIHVAINPKPYTLNSSLRPPPPAARKTVAPTTGPGPGTFIRGGGPQAGGLLGVSCLTAVLALPSLPCPYLALAAGTNLKERRKPYNKFRAKP